MPKKRILLVSPFPPSTGGVSSSVQRLSEVLINYGFDVVKFNIHFTSKKYNRFKVLKIVKYLFLPFFILTRERFDVIHFHVSDIFPKLYVSLWRGLFSKEILFIATIHGQVSHLLTSRLGFFSLKNFDRLICVREGDSLNMPESLKAKTVEIPAFIPPDTSEGSRSGIPDKIENFLKRDSFKILINGFIICNEKFDDLYGLKDAVILLEHLRNRGKNADMIIIILGYPYTEEGRKHLKSIREFAFNYNISDNICWVEDTKMELWPVLKKVHLFLRPTKSDGDALSVRESLCFKVPVIASDAVPRPAGTIVYRTGSGDDLLEKAISVIENHKECVSSIGDHTTSFSKKIIEQYEIK